MGDEGGALALAQVPQRALAGALLVAEDAEEIVDQLEADAEQSTDRVERLPQIDGWRQRIRASCSAKRG